MWAKDSNATLEETEGPIGGEVGVGAELCVRQFPYHSRNFALIAIIFCGAYLRLWFIIQPQLPLCERRVVPAVCKYPYVCTK